MTQLQIINYKNKRVLTTAQLAESFGTEAQILTNNFNRNKHRYSVGKHFNALEGQEKREFLNQHQNDLGSKTAAVLYLWTEKGAWMHAKSLNTDEAWDAYESLVDDYYSVKQEQIPLLDSNAAIAIALRQTADVMDKLPQIESRMDRIENTTTIDYAQQRALKKAGSSRVVGFLGGRKSAAYKHSSIRSSTYSALWNDYQEYFGINSYNNTLKKDCERGLKYVASWTPPNNLMIEIEETNGQKLF
ncbi:ORF6C domain-containing protein [Paenibacillus sp. P2(2022)]|uniref:ORF6C domain-containing protein n=1 Tax=Paenibacillus sp. P2(2022) TaxID=2917813 RepID=UPI0024074412|nr:ORF6C domain-containing protein [Paenibacillus sp. P2(2022)]MDG0056941.1 ORF6C domain-containing protein [Paenibacillus sp. P2(2022)]